MAASRSRTAMATWSISVRSMVLSVPAHATEEGDLVLADLLPEGRIVDPEAVGRREAAHAELAFGLVAVDGECRLACVLELVHTRQDRLDLAFGEQLVGVPGLLVVR